MARPNIWLSWVPNMVIKKKALVFLSSCVPVMHKSMCPLC